MTENTSPNARCCLSGTTANHSRDEKRSERSQKKAERMSTMTRTGSRATVTANRERGAPNAVRAQPKKDHAVMVDHENDEKENAHSKRRLPIYFDSCFRLVSGCPH